MRILTAVALSLLLLVGCGDDSAGGEVAPGQDAGSAVDGGGDAGELDGGELDASAELDGGADASSEDAGPDGGGSEDAGPDGGADAGADGSVDAGDVDAGSDAGLDAGPSGVLIFASSTTVAGDFGGLATADTLCQTAAANATLPYADSFVALLSDSSTDASSRFSGAGSVQLPSGALVANSYAELWTTGVMTLVNETETGASASILVWTGSDVAGLRRGTMTSHFCGDWTSTTGGASVGRNDRSDYAWFSLYESSPVGNGTGCSESLALYCVGPR